MQQSNFIFGILLVAYIVFITVKGELGAYLSLFKGAGSPGQVSASGTAGLLSSASGLLSSIGNFLSGGGGVGGNIIPNVASGSENQQLISTVDAQPGTSELTAILGNGIDQGSFD